MKIESRPAPFPWRLFAVLALLATTAVACWAAWEMREQRDFARSQVEGLKLKLESTK